MSQVSLDEFEKFIRQSFARNQLPIERCSQVFFSQLAHMPSYGGMNYPFQFVEREVIHLEGSGKTETKPATPFKENGKLKGLKHKHFYVPGYEHLGVNAKIVWELDRSKSRKFSEMALRLAKPYATEGENTPEELWKYSGEVAREIVNGSGGVKDRFANAEATGDWLIYTLYQGKSYYLCIAKHSEDDFILNAIKDCIPQFPFLAGIVRPREERSL